MSIADWLEEAQRSGGPAELSLNSDWSELLRSPIAAVRYFGIKLAWHRDELDLDTCLNVAQNDPDPHIRLVALDYIMNFDEARSSYLTKGITRSIALDSTQTADVRVGAYKTYLVISDLIWSSAKRLHDIESIDDIDTNLLSEDPLPGGGL